MYRRKRKEPLRRISEVLKVAATYSPTLPAFYLSVKKINVGTKRQPQDVRFTEIIVRGANRDKNSLLGKNKILYFVKEEERFLFYTNGKESHSNRVMRICIRFVLSIQPTLLILR